MNAKQPAEDQRRAKSDRAVARLERDAIAAKKRREVAEMAEATAATREARRTIRKLERAGPTPERVGKAGEDWAVEGCTVRLYDTPLDRALRSGRLSADANEAKRLWEAGDRYRRTHARAHMDPLRASDPSAVGGGAFRSGGAGEAVSESVYHARTSYRAAVAALGRQHRVVEDALIEEWAMQTIGRTRYGYRDANAAAAAAMTAFVIGLAVLADHYEGRR